MHGSPGKIHALLGQTALPGNFVLFHTGKMHVHYNSVLRVFPSKCLAKASICLKVVLIYTTASQPSIEGRVCQPHAVGICLPGHPGHWGTLSCAPGLQPGILPSGANQKCLQTSPPVLWGPNRPRLRTTAQRVRLEGGQGGGLHAHPGASWR